MTAEQELLDLTRRLLDSIAASDWQTYEELCDASLTAFEPESCGELVTGMPFHRFYFDQRTAESRGRSQTTIAAPHVRLMGDVALVCCVRLVQLETADGDAHTLRFEETRVWQRQEGGWRHVHFHRS